MSDSEILAAAAVTAWVVGLIVILRWAGRRARRKLERGVEQRQWQWTRIFLADGLAYTAATSLLAWAIGAPRLAQWGLLFGLLCPFIGFGWDLVSGITGRSPGRRSIG